MKRLFLLMGMFCVVVTANSQNYKGTVKDPKGDAVPFANAVLYTLPDSTFVAGSVTNDLGEFIIESTKPLNKGYIEISCIGYKSKTITAKTNAGIITLNEAKNELGEVVVKAELPKMQVKDDAFVTTIQNSVLAKAGTGNNVLQRLPMLTGKDGVYSVFGKGQAKIYINNREMRDAAELENLSSDDIKSVEIVTNPGARYDASVKAVIRIYTKKRRGDGFSFYVRSNYYQSPKNADWIENLNLNYRKKGWEFFGTISHDDITNLQNSTLEQTTNVDTLWRQIGKTNFTYRSKNIAFKGGVNCEISPKHFVGIKYIYKTRRFFEGYSTFTNNVYADGNFYDNLLTTSLEKNNDKSPKHILNTYYSGTFGKLDVNLDVTYYDKEESSETKTEEKSESFSDRIVHTRSNVQNKMFASRLVLTYPIWKGQFSVGNEFINTKRDDAYWADQAVPSSTTYIKQKSNSFFAKYAKTIANNQISAGLRYENINSDYFVNNIFMNDQSKNYKQLFLSFSYATRIKEVGLQLSYTSKTNRPTYRQLSNNTTYGNRFTMQSGNPFLSPSITHDITLAGSWKFLQLMLSYKHEKDAIIYWTEQMESKPSVSIIRYKNLNKLPQFVAYVGISPTFGIWSPQLNGGFQKQWLELQTNNQIVCMNKIMPFASFNNSFKFPQNFLFTVDMSFQGKGDVQNIYLSENKFTVDVGITKTFFDNRLSVAVKGWDIFKGKKDGNLLYNKQMELYQINSYDSRIFELSIHYKFNTAKSKYKGKGAGKYEIERL